ncbi:valine--tRNA ligase [Bdellovibrionota bacterium FG-1]
MSEKEPVRLPDRLLTKSYEPAGFEAELYRFWTENGCFEAADQNAPGQAAFSMVIPPPNVTGALHMGHALTNTIQDILVRWRRMKGDNTLWLPGTDHAGIATQTVVEKQLAKEGKGPSGRPLTRHDLGREAFVARTWKWKDEYGGQITHQLKRLGSSLDWKRERFTMDEGLSSAVREVFVRLHGEGLIYRGERIINWCPRCQTALSDLEVVPTERKGFFWHIVYKIVDDAGNAVNNLDGTPAELVIATTRPETLLGDTAVAVHPEDERYLHLHGKKALLPLLGRVIPVVTDTYVDREFGSGALKVTPAHDFNDYELGKRHSLEIIQVMGKDGRLTPEAGAYAGLKFLGGQGGVSEARAQVVDDLKTQGLLVKVEDHGHKVGLCQRCDTVAEPIMSKQWFVKIEPLAKPAIEAVESGRIQFSPKTWEKTYFEWMYNIRDWCISRQLWWGHQIPAWYCTQDHISVARTAPAACQICGDRTLRQDEDVLDTWFSSALWPFSTLGWPQETQALETFYPTAILETGFDIIFFWVARMIMMGLHFMGDVPFRKVYLHAMVRDDKGEKMSKTRGNVIDPLVVIDQHGTDSLRFTLAAMAGQGRDIKLSLDRVEGYRAFANKIWNAVKFFHLQMEEKDQAGNSRDPIPEPKGGAGRWLAHHQVELLAQNRWILSRLQTVIIGVEKGLANFELNEAAQALYDFTWREFCDWYIELAKLPLKEDGNLRLQTVYTLRHVLEALLRLLHPFMPFVTEELWQSLPWKRPALPAARRAAGKPGIYTLMLQAYPEPFAAFRDPEAEKTIDTLKTMIEALRNFRGENNISPKVEFPVRYVVATSAGDAFIRMYRETIQGLAKISSLDRVDQKTIAAEAESVIPISNPPIEFRISLKGLVNVEEESKRIQKEIEKVTSDIDFINNKLSKETFRAKAPPDLVAKEEHRVQELLLKRKELEAGQARLKQLEP